MSQNFERSQKFNAEPESILELINNFEAYKTFLPGCLESKRLSSQSEAQVRGLLIFGLIDKTYEFESINQTDGYDVQIQQTKGPFIKFSAMWSLSSSEPGITEVCFSSSFKLPFFFKIFASQSTIDAMGNKFLNAFAEKLSK
jgi:ribosome-associated toxin RatA of RatAB toxin-antitoxin module